MIECFLCIHCHFYQPSSKNPWLESVEILDMSLGWLVERIYPDMQGKPVEVES